MIQGIEDQGEFLRIDEIKAKEITHWRDPVGCYVGPWEKREEIEVFGHFRYQIRKLRRVSVGGLHLNKIPLGSFRELNEKEVCSFPVKFSKLPKWEV